MDKKKILIIGGGIGGLSTALRLSKYPNLDITIIEKNNQCGGRLNKIEKDGFIFDTGPSFFSMSYEFEELAKDAGLKKLPFDYEPLETLYQVSFNNGQSFKVTKNLDEFAKQFIKYEKDFPVKFKKYISKTESLYKDTVDKVIKTNFNNKLSYLLTLATVNPIHLPVLFYNFWDFISKYFENQKAKEIISLIAFFLGRSPFDTNAVYTLLSYIEFVYDGYFNVKGGMYKIVEGIVEELRKRNVKFIYNTEIMDFICENDNIKYFVDRLNNKYEADYFIVNSDAAYFRGKVFKREKFSEDKLLKMEWTSGYLTMYLGIDTKLNNINHHNYYLGDNYEKYGKSILEDPNLLDKPYYYVNVLTRKNLQNAPEGCESLFFVCPVPNLIYKQNWNDREQIAQSIIDDFSKKNNLELNKHIVVKEIFTPVEWQNKFNLFKGAGLGLSHNLWQIGAFRPTNFDEDFKNVFYVGASTVPGAGIPMAVISSKLVTDRILKKLAF